MLMKRERIQQQLARKGFQINAQYVVNLAITGHHARMHQDNLKQNLHKPKTYLKCNLYKPKTHLKPKLANPKQSKYNHPQES